MKAVVKYKSYFARVILTAYLSFFILDVIHCHPVDLLPETKIETGNKSTTENSDLYQINLKVVCQFQSVFSSIQTVDNLYSYVVPINSDLQGLFYLDKISKPLLKINFDSNLLRAPPSFN